MTKYLLISISLFAVSCLPEPIELTVEQAEAKPVVSTQIFPANGIALVLTKSFSALSDGINGGLEESDITKYLISNAQVSIEYNNRNIRLTEVTPGLYFSLEIEPLQNTTYTLNIDEFLSSNSVSSVAQVLPPIAINNVKTTIEERETGEKRLNVNYNFDDPKGKNYYLINLYINPKIPGVNPEFEDEIGGSKGGPPRNDFFGLGNLLSDFSESWLLTDDGFDGQSISEYFTIYNLSISNEDNVFMTLSNISEGYYNFLTARERSSNSIPFIAEPTTLPTNIEGGYGYFSMHYPSPIIVDLQ